MTKQSEARIARVCERCGKTFHVYPSKLKRYPCRVCSRACTKVPMAERFWRHVDKTGPAHPILTTPCWVWTGSIGKDGYGGVIDEGRALGTHRVSLAMAVGALRDDACVMHRCDNPPCVNPDHLREGTHAENVRDRDAKGRAADLRGENNNAAKLTEAQVAEVRELLAAGARQRDIAERFGISTGAVSDIKCGRTWPVPPDVSARVLAAADAAREVGRG